MKIEYRSLKDKLIASISHEKKIDQSIVRMVFNHQFDGLGEVMRKNFTVELSGFGTFKFNKRMAAKRLLKWEEYRLSYEEQLKNENLTPAQRRGINTKLNNMIEHIESINCKRDGLKEDIRRVEEQLVSKRGNDSNNKSGITREDGDL